MFQWKMKGIGIKGSKIREEEIEGFRKQIDHIERLSLDECDFTEDSLIQLCDTIVRRNGKVSKCSFWAIWFWFLATLPGLVKTSTCFDIFNFCSFLVLFPLKRLYIFLLQNIKQIENSPTRPWQMLKLERQISIASNSKIKPWKRYR